MTVIPVVTQLIAKGRDHAPPISAYGRLITHRLHYRGDSVGHRDSTGNKSSRQEELMMRCFFHLMDGTSAIRDESGVEVDDLAEARAQALAEIREFRRKFGAGANDRRNWTLTATDAPGRTLFSLPLDSPDLR